MAAPKKPQAEKPMSTPREHGLPLESESMRILQQAVAAAEQAMTGAEQITARASRLESAIDAVARNYQALIATRERAVAEAQERANQAIVAAEALLSRDTKPAPPQILPSPGEQAVETAREQADRASAVTEDAVNAIVKSTEQMVAGLERMEAGDASEVQEVMRQVTAAQERAVAVAQEEVRQAMSAAVMPPLPEAIEPKNG